MVWKVLEKTEYYARFVNQELALFASVKWDGCVEFHRFHNDAAADIHNGVHAEKVLKDTRNDDNTDQMHLCSLKETYTALQQLEELASKEIEKWDDPN